MPDLGPGLLGDKVHSVIFDNTKIKQMVSDFNPSISFAEGARGIINWHLADLGMQAINENYNAMLDGGILVYKKDIALILTKIIGNFF
ncbi:MAG: hypothetical protein JXA19_04550 [Anaerolineales bacterium]|nr:hypothetical protein [Anaerolineales bacterium]